MTIKLEDGVRNFNLGVDENSCFNIPVQNINWSTQGVVFRVIRCDTKHREASYSQARDIVSLRVTLFFFFLLSETGCVVTLETILSIK